MFSPLTFWAAPALHTAKDTPRMALAPSVAVEKMEKILNPFKPEFTIVIFIHYKPRIAVAILDL